MIFSKIFICVNSLMDAVRRCFRGGNDSVKEDRKRIINTFLLMVFFFVQCFFFLDYDKVLLRKPIYFISTIAFSLLLIQLHSILIRIFIFISLLLCIFIYPVYQTYGELDLLFIESVFYTTYEEAISYIKVVPIRVVIALVALSIFAFWLLVQDFYQFKNKNISYILLGVLLIFPVRRVLNDCNKNLEEYGNVTVIKKIIPIVRNFSVVNNEYNFIVKELKRQDTWEIIHKDEHRMKKNMVVVIGESVRRDVLHAYGFPIKNTSFIDASPNIRFENYIAAAPNTVPSLRSTLSVCNNLFSYELNNNIVTLANKLGYETYWISNQKARGEYDSPIAVMGKRAKEFYFFNGKIEDREMSPIMNKILNKNNQPKLIIIHMIGSHPLVCDITKGKYDEYILSDEISCYNKTIRMMDDFLGNLYHSLSEKNETYGLVYFSDHGLWISPDLSLTHSDFQENFNVPFILWADDIKHRSTILARRTGSDFLHFFTEFLGVKTKNINKNYRFISEEKAGEIKVLKRYEKELINYDQLKYNAIPYK